MKARLIVIAQVIICAAIGAMIGWIAYLAI